MNYPHLSLFVKRVTHSQSQEYSFFYFIPKVCTARTACRERHALIKKILPVRAVWRHMTGSPR